MDQQEMQEVNMILTSSGENNRYMHVVVQEIGGRYFLEFNDNLLSLEELSKYRKVFIANNQFYIYIYMVWLLSEYYYRL